MPSPLSLSLPVWWRSCRQSMLGLLFPPACVSCGDEFGALVPEPLICPACDDKLATAYVDPCPVCAMPDTTTAGCFECRERQHGFSAAVALGRYDGLLRQLVLRAKGGLDDALALALGECLAEQWQRRYAGVGMDGIVPVPISGVGRLRRRANLPDILAEGMSRRLALPRLAGVVAFQRNVKRQHDLKRAQRERNLRHALTATSAYDIKGAHLLVVDDVLTTGATADEMTRALLSGGAATVSVAVIARGIGLG